jgi:23S rRNA (cytosine1962-C5)-methyltransferase
MIHPRDKSQQRVRRKRAHRRRPPPSARAAAHPFPPLAADRLEAALAVRTHLLNDPRTTAGRLFNGAADGIDGLVIEKLGDVLIVQLHEQRLALDENSAREVCVRAVERLQARAAYRKVFPKDRSAELTGRARFHTDPTPWIGTPVEPEFAVAEGGVRFLVRPYDGYSTGLFLEHRANRQRVRTLAAGRRVLNAFAYTCGFTVVAALGQAVETVSVDISRRFLEWGKRNLSANSLPLAGHAFICSDIFDYYRRAQRQGRGFDLIILDPPTFARAKKPRRAFTVTEDLDRLVLGAVKLLAAGGYLLLCTNHRATPHRRLEQAVAAAAAGLGRRPELAERPELPEDFRGDPDYAKSILVRVD